MKKLLLITIIFISLTSCKKDFQCSCQTKALNNEILEPKITKIHDTEENAKKICEDKNTQTKVLGQVVSSVECTLK